MSDNEDGTNRAGSNVYNLEKKRKFPNVNVNKGTLSDDIFGIIPRDWFEVHVLGDENFDMGQSHIMLERIAGPAVGSFHLWRHQGYVHIRTLAAPDVTTDEAIWPERFRQITDAIEAIARAIGSQLQAWTLLLRRNQGRS